MKILNGFLLIGWVTFVCIRYGDVKPHDDLFLWLLGALSGIASLVNVADFLIKIFDTKENH